MSVGSPAGSKCESQFHPEYVSSVSTVDPRSPSLTYSLSVPHDGQHETSESTSAVRSRPDHSREPWSHPSSVGLSAAPLALPYQPRSVSPRLHDHPGIVSTSSFSFSPNGDAPDLRDDTPEDRALSLPADGKKEPPIRATYSGASVEHFYDHHRTKPNGYSSYLPLSGQKHHDGTNTPTVPMPKVKFTDSVGYWLGLYFFFNLGLTLFNKVVLVSFPFPYTLTGLHALSGCAGCYFALEQGAFVPARLTQKESMVLAAFSVLYTINIAVSNISLQLVTVPFHQVVRASTPLFTILIATVLLRQKFSSMKLISLLPVVAGVGFATYGDYYFTAWGLILTLLGTFLAALKTVVTNLIQTGGGGRLRLHPLDLLMRMSPLAFIQCVIYGWYTGELERVRRYGATQMTRSKAIALLVNGVIACGLNIVSFTANKKAGALTMTVSANCKQVLTIALAVVLFDLHINATNGIGILLTLLGGGWYGFVEFQEKNKKRLGKIVDKS
ncbi:hypothetical protein TREMEDRAFT_25821 [Tremella mesenterica DSM 1558]|uniref:uncharacterized protein n=1 Tax=Tremella mesenterica (strain ATCC 24925 / CBS 8224 / DSM 1558 / NBRC 9311 / NRRL Y-6157 / RJB 2259-6 / UBC 559-6) TaxID=578456 RepID=UPI0003F48C9B|nr:uncharacterized protein TREMEDRAFT_25821 [Tremella mesenterica DSM 1558]EIW72361.1 hypothetical protein TREMEDRAFT_25821 [Tremella mesenterica DSM 1558]